uniref:CSON001511 protein n=1 Tax=Culicoides sonorensis TaxID=179676 RepID=A0A336LUW2_CULSO
MLSKWEKFCLLFWKNCLLQKRRPLSTIFEILMPFILIVLMIFMRSKSVPIEFKEPEYYRPVNLNETNYISYNLAFAPNTRDAQRLMDVTLKKFLRVGPKPIKSFISGIDMDNFLKQNNDYVGIEIESEYEFDRPFTLNYSVRFPSELKEQQGTWATDLRFLSPILGYPESPYLQEGFVAIQHALFQGFMLLKVESGPSFSMQIQKFPKPPHIFDPFMIQSEATFSLIIVIGFFYSCLVLLQFVMIEKETQMKETMKVMGVEYKLHWYAWFAKYFAFYAIISFVMIILMKIKFFPSNPVTVLNYSGFTVLWTFMLLYSISAICFTFMMSVFFKKSNTAGSVASFIWFLSYFPFSMIQSNFASIGFFRKLISSLFCNSAVGIGFMFIMKREGSMQGLQWSNLFKRVIPDEPYSVGVAAIMLIFDSLLYIAITIYVEEVLPGDYGIPKKWNYIFQKSFWRKDDTSINEGSTVDLENQLIDPVYDTADTEPGTPGLRAGIETKNLRKAYGVKAVVKGLTMKMYENQITVLLGHNGAGKTSVFNMLTGMMPPSGGTATVNGFDIKEDLQQVQSSLGICPQHNVLFESLTVGEHIQFFGRLKGVQDTEIEKEVERYAELLQLDPNIQAKNLSGGMKRKLSIGVALCGDSKIILCDEPSSGVDPAARRMLWDLLSRAKRDRTILISSHFMDEADILGDRIAIMSDGELRAVGSSFYLKKKYGAGYHLICVKSKYCSVEEVTKFLSKYVPNITVENDIGSELSYQLSEKYIPVFRDMLVDLEENAKDIGIDSYGISFATLQEVFMKIGTENADEWMAKHTDGLYTPNGKHIDDELLPELVYETGKKLQLYQLEALFRKKIIYSIRNWQSIVLQIIVPVFYVLFTLIVYKSLLRMTILPGLHLTPDAYDRSTALLERNSFDYTTSKYSRIAQDYIDLFHSDYSTNLEETSEDMSQYFLSEAEDLENEVNTRYLFGATSASRSKHVIAWYNPKAIHSLPISIGLIHNAILQDKDPRLFVTVKNHPIAYRPKENKSVDDLTKDISFQLILNLTFSMIFVSAFYVIPYVKERAIKSKLLQLISGVRIYSYWIVAFICDFIVFGIVIFVSLTLIFAYQEPGWKTSEEFVRCIIVCLVFIWAILPITYISSLIFTIPIAGFSKLSSAYIYTSIIPFILVFFLDALQFKDISSTIRNLFILVPHFAFSDALSGLNQVKKEGDYHCFSKKKLACTYDYFSWSRPGIGKNIFMMVFMGAIAFTILFLIEYRIFHRLFHKGKQLVKLSVAPAEEGFVEEDVQIEKDRVQKMDAAQIQFNHLLFTDLTKYYGKLLAVNQLSLAVDRKECFGVLGSNGAGKSTLLKMLTGDETISFGKGFVQGANLMSELPEVYRKIGYCPQTDGVHEDFTAEEILYQFCLMRGIPKDRIAGYTHRLASEFTFKAELHKQVKELSGGTRRKLSAAISLIGGPSVIFLDEPTTGLDPLAKRMLWTAICKIRDQGRTIVLTSHSIEEAEYLCTRVAIMVNGEFKCLGSSQHLKNKFSQGYIITIKGSDNQLILIKEWMQDRFPGARLKETYQSQVTYHIPARNLKWYDVFQILETAKADTRIPIDDYSIGQTSLEQVYLSFIKKQREDDTKSIKGSHWNLILKN